MSLLPWPSSIVQGGPTPGKSSWETIDQQRPTHGVLSRTCRSHLLLSARATYLQVFRVAGPALPRSTRYFDKVGARHGCGGRIRSPSSSPWGREARNPAGSTLHPPIHAFCVPLATRTASRCRERAAHPISLLNPCFSSTSRRGRRAGTSLFDRPTESLGLLPIGTLHRRQLDLFREAKLGEQHEMKHAKSCRGKTPPRTLFGLSQPLLNSLTRRGLT